MTWGVERTPTFDRHYSNLSSEAQRRCDNVITELINADDPSTLGERLTTKNFKYRFGDYRLIYNVKHVLTLVELIDVGKRGRIYQ